MCWKKHIASQHVRDHLSSACAVAIANRWPNTTATCCPFDLVGLEVEKRQAVIYMYVTLHFLAAFLPD